MNEYMFKLDYKRSCFEVYDFTTEYQKQFFEEYNIGERFGKTLEEFIEDCNKLWKDIEMNYNEGLEDYILEEE